MRMVEVPERKFLYVCDRCPKELKWMELADIYQTNM